ncbi:MAG: hypothetical protein LBF02_01765, partial [Mycoplasmataceae bacterium]|nr:hypothetical protein [Mycoplasmataceae bacterium]
MTKQQTRILNDECERILHAQADATRYELLKNSHLPDLPPIDPPDSILEPSSVNWCIPNEFMQLLQTKIVGEEENDFLCSSIPSLNIINGNFIRSSLIQWSNGRNTDSIWLIRQLTTVCFELAESSFQIIKKEIETIKIIQEKIKCCEKVKRQCWRLSSTKKDAQDQIRYLNSELSTLPNLQALQTKALKPLNMLMNLANFTNRFLIKEQERLHTQEIDYSRDIAEEGLASEQRKTLGSSYFRTLFPTFITAKTSNAICCAMFNNMRKTFIGSNILEENYPKLTKTKIDDDNNPDCTFTPSDCSTICKAIMKRKQEIRVENEQELQRQGSCFGYSFQPYLDNDLQFPIFPVHSFVHE